jgi:hypothetical protein
MSQRFNGLLCLAGHASILHKWLGKAIGLGYRVTTRYFFPPVKSVNFLDAFIWVAKGDKLRIIDWCKIKNEPAFE